MPEPSGGIEISITCLIKGLNISGVVELTRRKVVPTKTPPLRSIRFISAIWHNMNRYRWSQEQLAQSFSLGKTLVKQQYLMRKFRNDCRWVNWQKYTEEAKKIRSSEAPSQPNTETRHGNHYFVLCFSFYSFPFLFSFLELENDPYQNLQSSDSCDTNSQNNSKEVTNPEKELTALEGDGQQCKAAPAWTASIEPDAKGSLETSARTRARLLQIPRWYTLTLQIKDCTWQDINPFILTQI